MNILLTRALTQVKPLQNLVIQYGYQPILFPTLELKPLNNAPLKNHYDALIFISVNAVEYGLKRFKDLATQDSQIFAMGSATANKLNQYDFKVDAFPAQKSSSEALLAMEEIKALVNKDILIIRGQGGREILKEVLKKRNVVEYIEVYQRLRCSITALHKSALSEFLQSDKGVITTTSIANLSAFLSIVEQINPSIINIIKNYPLIALSERIKIFAQFAGFTQVEVATKTDDEGLMKALKRLDKNIKSF